MASVSQTDQVNRKTEETSCPYCRTIEASVWATDNGYNLAKCTSCGFLYVNPRPVQALISEAVETGVHTSLGGHHVVGRRVERKVREFRSAFRECLSDVWAKGAPISWLDVGAGFGEVVEAVGQLAPPGSRIVGLEPMVPKARAAEKRGLVMVNGYLSEVTERYEYVSLIHVFSHIPDFRAFLADLQKVLKPGGELIVVSGNIGDLDDVKQVASELDLPDHLTFCGQHHLVGFLKEAGFEIVSERGYRRDTVMNLLKNIAKKIMGRSVQIAVPYTSPYRNIVTRARIAQPD